MFSVKGSYETERKKYSRLINKIENILTQVLFGTNTIKISTFSLLKRSIFELKNFQITSPRCAVGVHLPLLIKYILRIEKDFFKFFKTIKSMTFSNKIGRN